jgi:hypothetical protein
MSRADEVDLDRLADYAADALEPAAADEVGRLVRTDARWARALDAIVAADEAVRGDLRAAADEAVTMPTDVADRISVALGDLRASGPRRVAEAPVVSLAAARARRRRRWTTSVAAAAATLVLVLCGITVYRGDLPSTTSESAAGNGPPRDADQGALPPAPAQGSNPDRAGAFEPLVVASGFDYADRDLTDLLQKPPAAAIPQLTSGDSKELLDSLTSVPTVPAHVRRAVPVTLTRLTDPASLQACLATILKDHPGVPILYDYARYGGRPALIVSIRNGTTTTVVAVGGDCGIAGSHELAAVRTP